MNTETFDIQPGTICTMMNPWSGKTYQMAAVSNIVNSSVQFFFTDHYEWIDVSEIVAVHQSWEI